MAGLGCIPARRSFWSGQQVTAQSMVVARSGDASLVVEYDDATGQVTAITAQDVPHGGASLTLSGPVSRSVNVPQGTRARTTLPAGLSLDLVDGQWQLPNGAVLAFGARQ